MPSDSLYPRTLPQNAFSMITTTFLWLRRFKHPPYSPLKSLQPSTKHTWKQSHHDNQDFYIQAPTEHSFRPVVSPPHLRKHLHSVYHFISLPHSLHQHHFLQQLRLSSSFRLIYCLNTVETPSPCLPLHQSRPPPTPPLSTAAFNSHLRKY